MVKVLGRAQLDTSTDLLKIMKITTTVVEGTVDELRAAGHVAAREETLSKPLESSQPQSPARAPRIRDGHPSECIKMAIKNYRIMVGDASAAIDKQTLIDATFKCHNHNHNPAVSRLKVSSWVSNALSPRTLNSGVTVEPTLKYTDGTQTLLTLA